MPHSHHGIAGKAADAVGLSMTLIGSGVYTVLQYVATLAQVNPGPNTARTQEGGWTIAMMGLATLLVKGVFSELKSRRDFAARQDDSLQKLAHATAEKVAAEKKLEETQRLYESMSLTNAALLDKLAKIDDNSKRIVEFSESLSALAERGYFRVGEDDDTDLRVMEHILIVEDDTDTAKQLKRMFMAKGFNVHVASTCAEAKVKILRYDPKWITLDLVLPDCSGLEVLRYIRDAPRSFAAKVFVVTGAAESSMLDQIAEFRPFAVLTKPFSPSYMWDLMAESGEFANTLSPKPPTI